MQKVLRSIKVYIVTIEFRPNLSFAEFASLSEFLGELDFSNRSGRVESKSEFNNAFTRSPSDVAIVALKSSENSPIQNYVRF